MKKFISAKSLAIGVSLLLTAACTNNVSDDPSEDDDEYDYEFYLDDSENPDGYCLIYEYTDYPTTEDDYSYIYYMTGELLSESPSLSAVERAADTNEDTKFSVLPKNEIPVVPTISDIANYKNLKNITIHE